jgi:hypothetical protein
MVRMGDKLEKEKEEMNVLDAIFKEKTEKLAHVIQIQHKVGGEKVMMSEEDIEVDMPKGQKKVAISKRNYVVANKTSSRVIDKTTKVLEKAQKRREATY